VGADSSSLYPPEARALPQVGYMRQIAVEGVISLAPDLIIASPDIGPPAAVEKLERLGIPMVRTRPANSIDSAAERIREVGRALDRSEKAEQLARAVSEKARAESERLNGLPGPRPRVALFLGHNGRSPMGSGSGTSGDAMIRLAGGDNALSGMQGFKTVPAEALIQAAPDVIVFTVESVAAAGSPQALLKRLPGIEHTPAGREGRVVVMDLLELFSFGPRLPDSIAKLGDGLRAPRLPQADGGS
ncbi:MAG: ABC transporter substrate-binding protein, partial [Halothiobacillaceae bacterium]|nr:ABC transporter substrate-binding protein [Halothiobacillaceae bacterium]